jgi:hypothetical protein
MMTPSAPVRPRAWDSEEALDLLVDPADGLDLAVLVDGAGDGQGLLEGDVADGGE